MSDRFDSRPIQLDQFLKLTGVVSTGGHAKLLIQSGEVKLNGEVETRRRKKLAAGDLIEFLGEEFVIAGDDSGADKADKTEESTE